jgi:hypothetical protein
MKKEGLEAPSMASQKKQWRGKQSDEESGGEPDSPLDQRQYPSRAGDLADAPKDRPSEQ